MFANTDVEENWLPKDGASEGIRTLDTHVGNVMLYQAELRSLPIRLENITGIRANCKRDFEQTKNGRTFAPRPRTPRPRACAKLRYRGELNSCHGQGISHI